MSEKQKIVNVPKDMAADLKERSDYELVCAKLNIAMKGNYPVLWRKRRKADFRHFSVFRRA